MEKIVDIVAPRNSIDLFLKVLALISSFTAFDYFIGEAMRNLTSTSIMIELVTTLFIAAPFGIFVMSIMGIQRRLKEKLRYLAETDQLTGLANRQAFMARAGAALSEQPNSTILMIDVDHFKRVNDTHGHFVGDISLRLVARHLVENVRAGDVVGRLGGEEFAVMLTNADKITAEYVSARICKPMEVDAAADLDKSAPSFVLTMSVGGIMALPGQNLTELIRHADAALYTAKSTGRARAVFYECDGGSKRVAC
ncbi:GGDEF domain-containing protein [uncultured Roseobacter sp.]|uniref:GGDEF domain-containing protein n=1 Tax=uncultured Roseobacter sp. TaxID=114847 RepID=UPI00260A9C27|nr:GGDEF domain-containing protein [uncultured Roseobacter sp.]